MSELDFLTRLLPWTFNHLEIINTVKKNHTQTNYTCKIIWIVTYWPFLFGQEKKCEPVFKYNWTCGSLLASHQVGVWSWLIFSSSKETDYDFMSPIAIILMSVIQLSKWLKMESQNRIEAVQARTILVVGPNKRFGSSQRICNSGPGLALLHNTFNMLDQGRPLRIDAHITPRSLLVIRPESSVYVQPSGP